MKTGRSALVVDDEELIRWSLAEELRSNGFDPVVAGSLAEARELAKQCEPELCIFDVRLPDGSGVDLLRDYRARDQDLPIIMITGHGSARLALEVTEVGATDYLPKPYDLTELMLVVTRAMANSQRRRELRVLRHRSSSAGYPEIIGDSVAMNRLFELLHRLEDAQAPTVLVHGESGTGKELVARAIHKRSKRRDSPFLEVDCTGLTDNLIQSELFGHERGSFTDAKQRKLGLFEIAGDGTIFLDEIGELALPTQSRLLRALENRRFKRVGGTADISFKARVVVATNKDLQAEVKAGRFRADLYYRLNVIPVVVPALRYRDGDIPLLASHFTSVLGRGFGRSQIRLGSAALDCLSAYEWPGNVRQLRNALERAVILCPSDEISVSELPPEVRHRAADFRSLEAGTFVLPEAGVDLAALERSLLLQALDRCNGNQSAAARLLSIGRYALRYRMEKFDLLGSRSVSDQADQQEALDDTHSNSTTA